MAYDGELINYCSADLFDFSSASAVVVSGATGNPCGHLLLNTGGFGGTYFHVARVHDYPRYMDETCYQRYLRENGKTELRRYPVHLNDSLASTLKLEELLSRKWLWLLLPNNCARFVEEVVQAGGSSAGLYFNCPSQEAFD